MRQTSASCLATACFSLNSSSVEFVMFFRLFLSPKNSEAMPIKLKRLRCARNVSGGFNFSSKRPRSRETQIHVRLVAERF
jgi:hypothetical protein